MQKTHLPTAKHAKVSFTHKVLLRSGSHFFFDWAHNFTTFTNLLTCLFTLFTHLISLIFYKPLSPSFSKLKCCISLNSVTYRSLTRHIPFNSRLQQLIHGLRHQETLRYFCFVCLQISVNHKRRGHIYSQATKKAKAKQVNLNHTGEAEVGFYFQAQNFLFWCVGKKKEEKALVKPIVFNIRG